MRQAIVGGLTKDADWSTGMDAAAARCTAHFLPESPLTSKQGHSMAAWTSGALDLGLPPRVCECGNALPLPGASGGRPCTLCNDCVALRPCGGSKRKYADL